MKRRERPQRNNGEKTVEIDLVSFISVFFLVLMGVLLLFILIHFVKKFIPVNRFEIVGESAYEVSELCAAAHINEGDKLFRIDTDRAEDLILNNCPYVESISIRRTLFGKLKFDIKCYEPLWYIEISGDYYVLDGELRVLEETQDRAKLYDEDLIFITMPHVRSAIVGESLVFGDSEGEVEQTKTIMEIILSSPALEMICSADIDNRYDIHFEFDRIFRGDLEESNSYIELDDVFLVNVGGYTRLDAKLEYILKAISNEKLEGVVGGTIDVSDVGNKVSIRPIYAQ